MPGSKPGLGMQPGSRINLLNESNQRLQVAVEKQPYGARMDPNEMNGVELTLNRRTTGGVMADDNWMPMLDADYLTPVTAEQLHQGDIMFRNPFLPPERTPLPNRYTLQLNSSDMPHSQA